MDTHTHRVQEQVANVVKALQAVKAGVADLDQESLDDLTLWVEQPAKLTYTYAWAIDLYGVLTRLGTHTAAMVEQRGQRKQGAELIAQLRFQVNALYALVQPEDEAGPAVYSQATMLVDAHSPAQLLDRLHHRTPTDCDTDTVVALMLAVARLLDANQQLSDPLHVVNMLVSSTYHVPAVAPCKPAIMRWHVSEHTKTC
jgi:hypothetical protein